MWNSNVRAKRVLIVGEQVYTRRSINGDGDQSINGEGGYGSSCRIEGVKHEIRYVVRFDKR